MMGKLTRPQLKGRNTIYSGRFKKNLLRTDSIQALQPGAVIQGFCRHPLSGKPLARVKNPQGSLILIPALKGQVRGSPVHSVRLSGLPQGTTVCTITPLGGGAALTAPGCKGLIVGKSGPRTLVKINRRVASFPDALCLQGTIGGGDAHQKPLLKAGTRSIMMKARLKKYPIVSAHKMNVHQSPLGGSNRKKRGRSMTPSRRTSPGGKTGSIAASRTGRRH